MATLLLQAAGAFLGGMFGPVGAAIGTAAGAYGGYLIDQSLINSTRRIEGPRLSRPSPLTGEDGSPLARVFGVARVSGTLIWATRFEEASKTERQGGKGGGPKLTTYSYFANFAVAICEGEISHVRRIWADGQELDLTVHDIRIYKGSEDQLPDPLIEAKQGTGNAPAYRGTAYVVFDRFALADFGNRIPQLQFEVIRQVGGIANTIEAITLIPGSTEFGLSPTLVTGVVQPGETLALNRHVLHAETDWKASLDELQALCPNLKKVALVVAWFGTDLRAGVCQIKPGVVTADAYANDTWLVAGQTRSNAHVVSTSGTGASYGGTPDDKSVIEAIQDLKARGLEVTLYPFILMDIPAGNALPSPYGTATQPAYPWRGELTCDPAPGQPSSVDATALAGAQIAAFAGTAIPAQFSHAGTIISYSGPSEWSYRRLALHYAQLALAAGGVDAFLIGSEMKGLTRVRDATGFPFVNQLMLLAADVRAKLGAGTKLTYAADWSEYGAYTPPAGNDLRFPLDPLWAHPAIDAIGIDNYMPLSDWRDTDWDGDNPDGATDPNDPRALEAAVESGEGHDWFYATQANRAARLRTPITDGSYNKPWVYRFKDIRSWWMNSHYERIAGIELTTPTPFVPGSKSIWFTELGCPAIDKGANQPNVFSDPKSSASAEPYFSNGGRDDAAQMAFLAAHAKHWKNPANNPLHPVTGKRLLQDDRIYLWAWDARPFPAFPVQSDVWGDGGNWMTGHWLNGRLTNVMVADLIGDIASSHGLNGVNVDTVRGCIGGFVLFGPTTAREALDTLLAFLRIEVREAGDILTFESHDLALPQPAPILVTVAGNNEADQTETRLAERSEMPELALQYRDPLSDHKVVTARSSGFESVAGTELLDLPLVLNPAEANALVKQARMAAVPDRQTLSISLPFSYAALVAGDRIRLEGEGEAFRIMRLVDGESRLVEAVRSAPPAPVPRRAAVPVSLPAPSFASGPPKVVFLDLPTLPQDTASTGLRVAGWLRPWKPLAVMASASSAGFATRMVLEMPADIGVLTAPLPAGNPGLFDLVTSVLVRLAGANLQSVSDAQLFAGANACAIRSEAGAWEILQFGMAVEVAPDTWQLTRLLRGQLGTADAAAAGALTGAEFVLLDDAVKNAGLTQSEAENGLNWKTGPADRAVNAMLFDSQLTGPARRALTPNAPVHLKAKHRADGVLDISFIRCGQADADGWDRPEIPLNEGFERYRLRLFTMANELKRQVDLSAPFYAYQPSTKVSDFGSITEAILDVAQIDAGGLPGLSARIPLSL